MDDPGWRLRMTGTPDGLLLLRSMFISFCAAIVLIGVATMLIVGGADDDGMPPVLGVMLTAAAGVVAQLIGRSVERPLDCTSEQTLASSYRTRFFLRLAFAESTALVGFVLSILSGSVLPYLVGMLGTFAGFARLAPTAVHLEDDQQALTAQGCALSLVDALRGATPRT